MKKQTVANISLVLALMLWPIAWVIFDVVCNEHEPNARGVMLAGMMIPLNFVFLIAAAWLAGYSYTEAKMRAIISTLCCFCYVFAFTWLFWK